MTLVIRSEYSYSAFQLAFRSEVPLPELPPSEGECDACIRLGSVPLREGVPNGEIIPCGAHRSDLFWDWVGIFSIRRGREIIIDPDPRAEPQHWRPYLLGSALGILLQQRGLSVFHAGVAGIQAPPSAFALIGEKEHGKSTLNASLFQRGTTFVSDDLAVIRFEDHGAAVYSGIPQFKLWHDSLRALNLDPATLPMLHDRIQKRVWRAPLDEPGRVADGPLPLRAVYILEKGERIGIEPLEFQPALTTLLPHWHGARFGETLLRQLGLRRHFQECSRLVKTCRFFKLVRTGTLEELPDLTAAVLDHFRGVSVQAPILNQGHGDLEGLSEEVLEER